ncbi:MAG: hypothetical protein U0I22_03500 [Treponema sp.]|nr:hypothetical protein [Treponema sp.]
MKRKTRNIIKKISSLIIMMGLLAGLTSCEMWYKDWKGYLDYWSSTVQIGKIEVSNITIQKDINNKSTISTEATPVITGYIINPQGYSFENTTIGSSDDIDKTVRIDNQDVKNLAKINSTDTTSISVQISAASQSLEHQDFTVTIAPVRTATGVSLASQSISLRYNTPPVAPTPVNYDGASYSIPSGNVIWEQKDGKLYWAWEKDMNTADGADETAQNCVASFAINGKSIPVTALTKTVQTINNIPYDVYSYDIGTATKVKLQALDSDGIAGKSRTTHVTQDVPVTPNPGTPNPDPGPSTTQEPSTVYVDGPDGDDNNNDGLTPSSPVKTINKALEIIYDLNNKARNDGKSVEYTLVLLDDYSREVHAPSIPEVTVSAPYEAVIKVETTTPLTLTITSDTGKKYSIDANGSDTFFQRVLYISQNVTVTLENITLEGGYCGQGGGIRNQGTLFIKEGTLITNNTNGGGVYNEGTFTMTAGEISGNTNYGNGGGVYNGGTFTMNGGKITGNRLSVGSPNKGAGLYKATGSSNTIDDVLLITRNYGSDNTSDDIAP